MEWCSPTRRSHDGRTLAYIPTEIYLEILSRIKYNVMAEYDDNPHAKRVLTSLSLVCRFFFATISPWLFHSLCFDGTEREVPECPSTFRFCRKLLDEDKHSQLLAPFVKKCEFFSWNSYYSNNIRLSRMSLKMYSESLHYFHNLEELCLVQMTISKDLLVSIHKLQNLTTLRVSECDFDKDVRSKHLKKLSCLKLRHLDFHCFTPDEPLSYFNLDHMLHLGMYKWPSSPPYGVGELSSLPLEELLINTLPCMSAVGPFLTMVPHLKHIVVAIIETQDIDGSALPNAGIHFVPELESIRGPPDLLSFLGPRRKLASINVLSRYESMNEDIFKYIRDLACPISRLCISHCIYSSVPLWKYLPKLDRLEVTLPVRALFNGTFKVVDEFSACQTKHPQVRYLRLETDGIFDKNLLNLPYQRELLSRMLLCFPTIRVFSVVGFILWTYSESSGTWNPEVAPEKNLDILFLLDGDFEFVESRPYRECFARSVAFQREAKYSDFVAMMSRKSVRSRVETYFLKA